MNITNTPFTLQAVSPVVGHAWGNVPVLGSLSDVCRRPCESVANCPLPCESYGRFKLLKISASDFSIISMYKRFHACVYEFLTIMVTEGVLHSVYKVVIRLSFGVITATSGELRYW